MATPEGRGILRESAEDDIESFFPTTRQWKIPKMTATSDASTVLDKDEAKSLAITDSNNRCFVVGLRRASEDACSGGGGTTSTFAAAASPVSSGKCGEKSPSSFVASSVERQHVAALEACEVSAIVTTAGAETTASAFATSEVGSNLHRAAAVASCPTNLSRGVVAYTWPGSHAATAAAAGLVPASARRRSAVGASSSSAASAECRVIGSQLQSLSSFSHSVGIREFALCDSFTAAARGKRAAAEGEGAAAEVEGAAETAKPHALRGSLKTLFEDFQVYEQSCFRCVCRDAQRTCSECGSSDESIDTTATCCSSSKRDSSLSSSSSSSTIQSDRVNTSSCLKPDNRNDSRRLKGNGSKEEKSTSSSRWNAAADEVALEPCAYGCWCKAFGGDKPLRLPYLVLPSDVLRRKQQQLDLESGVGQISSSFCLKPCESFLPVRRDRHVECSSSSSTSSSNSSSTDTLIDCRETISTNSANSRVPSLRPTSFSADVASSGSSSGSSSVGDAGNVPGKFLEREKTCESHKAKAHCSCCPAAVAAATPETTSAPAGLTAKIAERSFPESCPFSSLEIQNVEAFVRFLARSSALYRHRREVSKGRLQLEQEPAQQEEEAGAVLHEQQQEQQKRANTARRKHIQQQSGDPRQQQGVGKEGVLPKRNIVDKRGAIEAEVDLTSKAATQFALKEESKISANPDAFEGSCPRCRLATATTDRAAERRWEEAAARVAAEAEEAAVAAATVAFAETRWHKHITSSGSSRSSLVQKEAWESSPLQTATSENNPFFEPGELHNAEPAADRLLHQTKEAREESEVEQLRQQQPSARGNRRMKGQRQTSSEGALGPLTQQQQERLPRESESRDEQQKRKHKRQAEKHVFQPVLWILGDWVSFICRHMIEGERARDAHSSVSADAAGLRIGDTLSTVVADEEVKLSLECHMAVTGYAAGAVPVVSARDSAVAAAPSVAPAAVAADQPSVSDRFAVAVAACVHRSPPSLKELLKTVRTSVHDFARQNLPFVYADTLPLSLYLRDEQQQRYGPHSKEHEQQTMQQRQLRSEQTEEERKVEEVVHEKDAPDAHENEQRCKRKRLQAGGDVRMEDMKERCWGLLRMYTLPGALQCLNGQSLATTAATTRRAAGAAGAEAAAAAQAEARGVLTERAATNGSHAEASERTARPTTLGRSGVSDHALVSETGEEEQRQFLKYFVSVAACVAQQCQALQQLLMLLQRQQHQMHMHLSHTEEAATSEQRQLQHEYPHEYPHEEQRKGQQCWPKKQQLLVHLGRCEQWIRLLTAALAALTDEKQQPHLLLMRLTPMPSCMHYLFPRRNKEMPEEPQQQHRHMCVDFRSCSGAATIGLETRNSSLCSCSLNRRDQSEGLAKISPPQWCLPVHLRRGHSTAPFLHFVLLKINRETAAAMRVLEQQLRHRRVTHSSSSSSSWVGEDGRRRDGRPAVNVASVTVAAAGTKDKRGVTVQRCSVSKVSADGLLEACYLGYQQRQRSQRPQQRERGQLQQHCQFQQHQQLQQSQVHKSWHQVEEVVHEEKTCGRSCPFEEEQLPTIFVAPLGYYSEPQWLGGLRGNFFQVVIRNVRLAADTPCCGGTATPTSASEEPSRSSSQTSCAASRRDARVGSGSAAAIETAAVISRTIQTEPASTRIQDRCMESQEQSARVTPAAAIAAAAAASTEDARARDIAQTLPPPTSSTLATAQDAKDSQGSHSNLKKCVSPQVGAAERKQSELLCCDATVSSPTLYAPLSTCEKNVQQLGEAVSSSMSSFRSLGFLNYYGLQRFGTHTVRTYEVGAALLRRDWTAAVAGILGAKMHACFREAANDAAGRHVKASSEGTANPLPTECATVCEAAAAAGVACDSQSACTQSVTLGPGKQQHSAAAHAMIKSPWELLQEEGPAIALNSLAKHQHIERVILSALLHHSKTTHQTHGRDVEQSALKGRRSSLASSPGGTPTATAEREVTPAETSRVEAPAASARPLFVTQAPICLRAAQLQRKDFFVSPAVYFRALLEVAPASLQLYLHAAQSVLFNFACSWRWRTYGRRVRVGDFVYNKAGFRSSTTETPLRALSFDEERIVDDCCDATTAAGSSRQHDAFGTGERFCVQEADVDNLEVGCSSFAKKDKENQSESRTVESPADSAHFSATSASGSQSWRREEVSQVSGCDEAEKGGNCSSRQTEAVQARPRSESIRRITTEEEACNASIHDVVLPLAGTDVEYPADLLAVYQQLSREILGVRFEAFQVFNTLATKRKCFSRQFRRQKSHDKRLRSNNGREINCWMSRKRNWCDSRSERDINSSNSTGSAVGSHRKSDHCSNTNCNGTKGEGRLEKKKNEQEAQQGASDFQTSAGCCEGERDVESERSSTALLMSSVTTYELAEAEEDMDPRNLGISCKGGFRRLVVRPRHCSWQLLRVGDDPDAEPKPLLLTDVDLLLRCRHNAAKAEKLNDGMFLHGNSVQQHTYVAAEDDYRVGFDEELFSHVVRCIPGSQERVHQVVSDMVVSKCGSTGEGIAGIPQARHESETACFPGTISRASPSIDDLTGPDEYSLTEEMTKHAYLHQEQVRTQRTNLVVHGERSNFCLLLKFWLPAGCYFTMALREIMRANAPDEDGAAFAGARHQNAIAD